MNSQIVKDRRARYGRPAPRPVAGCVSNPARSRFLRPPSPRPAQEISPMAQIVQARHRGDSRRAIVPGENFFPSRTPPAAMIERILADQFTYRFCPPLVTHARHDAATHSASFTASPRCRFYQTLEKLEEIHRPGTNDGNSDRIRKINLRIEQQRLRVDGIRPRSCPASRRRSAAGGDAWNFLAAAIISGTVASISGNADAMPARGRHCIARRALVLRLMILADDSPFSDSARCVP